jgi:hypothetical protein
VATNIFDNIPALAEPKRSEKRDELTAFLSTDPEYVDNVTAWWLSKRAIYPRLSQMALDYLTIPGEYFAFNSCLATEILLATSVDVERVFSRGRLILSHVRNRLSSQTTRALLCLGSWSLLGLVKDKDVLNVAVMPDVEGEEEIELGDGWDSIKI